MPCMTLGESLRVFRCCNDALTTGGVTEAVYGSLVRIQRGWSYRYQYRVIVGVWMPHRNLLVMERTYYRYMYLQDG